MVKEMHRRSPAVFSFGQSTSEPTLTDSGYRAAAAAQQQRAPRSGGGSRADDLCSSIRHNASLSLSLCSLARARRRLVLRHWAPTGIAKSAPAFATDK